MRRYGKRGEISEGEVISTHKIPTQGPIQWLEEDEAGGFPAARVEETSLLLKRHTPNFPERET